MNKYQLNRRRYYVTGKLRKVLHINTVSRTISVTDEKLKALSIIPLKYLIELKAIYNYQAQYEIE